LYKAHETKAKNRTTKTPFFLCKKSNSFFSFEVEGAF